MMLWYCIGMEALLSKGGFWIVSVICVTGSFGPITETHEPILVFDGSFVEFVPLWQAARIFWHNFTIAYAILEHDL